MEDRCRSHFRAICGATSCASPSTETSSLRASLFLHISPKKLHHPLGTAALWWRQSPACPSCIQGQSRFVGLPGLCSHNSLSTLEKNSKSPRATLRSTRGELVELSTSLLPQFNSASKPLLAAPFSHQTSCFITSSTHCLMRSAFLLLFRLPEIRAAILVMMLTKSFTRSSSVSLGKTTSNRRPCMASSCSM